MKNRTSILLLTAIVNMLPMACVASGPTIRTSRELAARMAGPITSGGGAGIFCPISVPNQPAVQLLDFYEGKIFQNYTITETAVPYADQIKNMSKLLTFDFSLSQDFTNALAGIMSNYSFLPSGVAINAPSDLGSGAAIPLPTGCYIGAIGYYQSNSQLLISSDAFSSLSETQKAAFFVHEALYKVFRSRVYENEQSSAAPTRQLVANLFSEQVAEPSLRRLSWPMTYCHGGSPLPNASVAPGMEASVAYLCNVGAPHYASSAPILLDQSGGGFTVTTSNVLGYNEEIRITCENNISLDIEQSFSSEGSKIHVLQAGALPKDCGILTISIKSESMGTNSPSTFKIEYNGKAYIGGLISNIPSGYFDMELPIYYNL